MPKVIGSEGEKDFPYTPQGELDAEAYANATGGTVVTDAANRSQYFYGGQVDKMYKEGGKVKK